MEREFTVVVRVSSQEHADLIQKDVENIVSLRTSIYHVTEAKQNKKSVSDYYYEAHPEALQYRHEDEEYERMNKD